MWPLFQPAISWAATSGDRASAAGKSRCLRQRRRRVWWGLVRVFFTHGALSCVNKYEGRESGLRQSQLGRGERRVSSKQNGSVFQCSSAGGKKKKKKEAKGEERGEQATSCRCSHVEKQQTADYCVFSCTLQGRRGRRLFSAWLVSNGPVKKLDCFPLLPPKNSGCTSTCAIIETLT